MALTPDEFPLSDGVFSGGSKLTDGFLKTYLNELGAILTLLQDSLGQTGALFTDVKVANYTGVVQEIVLYDPTDSQFLLTFPLSPAKDEVFGIKNNTQDQAPVDLDGNGNSIEGLGDLSDTFKTLAVTDIQGPGLFGFWKFDGVDTWLIIGSEKVPQAVKFAIDVNAIGKGGNAPAEVDLGTTPTIKALRFTATNQTISSFHNLPKDRLSKAPIQIKYFIQLVNSEIDGDDIDGTLDYVLTVPESDDGGVSKVSSQITTTVKVTTAKGLNAGDPYELLFTIPAEDANNPLTINGSIGFEFHLTNISDVSAVDLLGASLTYVI